MMATEEQQHAMKSPRPLEYDVDTGTLRFCKTTPRASRARQEGATEDNKLLGCGVESGESSPTCVIQNSAARSNSSSPTMEGRRSYSASSTATTKSVSPESGPVVVPGHKVRSTQTPPFKSIQSAAADKRKKMSNQSSSIMHKAAPGIFSFNAAYMRRVDGDGEATRRTTTTTFPLLKPTPSKWDDAEKWVPGASESQNSKSRSGPLLAQMVASQAGMLSMPFPSWKPHLQKPPLEATDPIDEVASPSRMNGSFMNLGVRGATRDMGTAMTPMVSSVVGTPGREDVSVMGMMMTEEEMAEKTRQEIVALGTQLGKASIAAAWAHASRADHQPGVVAAEVAAHVSGGGESRADAWKEAETAKLTIRFQQEEAKIAAWEEQEKAKAEAEMRRAEAKAERMKTQAHEKRANKVAATVRRGEKLRHDAETRRTEATDKVTQKAELMKRHHPGKLPNLLFLSFLCT